MNWMCKTDSQAIHVNNIACCDLMQAWYAYAEQPSGAARGTPLGITWLRTVAMLLVSYVFCA